jgi:hypothetical protein
VGGADAERLAVVPAIRYIVVESGLTGLRATTLDSQRALYDHMQAARAEFRGVESSPALRQELRGQPRFDKFCGPMWGGADEDGGYVVRYEDRGANEALSS